MDRTTRWRAQGWQARDLAGERPRIFFETSRATGDRRRAVRARRRAAAARAPRLRAAGLACASALSWSRLRLARSRPPSRWPASAHARARSPAMAAERPLERVADARDVAAAGRRRRAACITARAAQRDASGSARYALERDDRRVDNPRSPAFMDGIDPQPSLAPVPASRRPPAPARRTRWRSPTHPGGLT